MTVSLWLARFWSTECPVNNAPYFGHSNEMMGSVDFLGECPAGSHLKSSEIEHWGDRPVVRSSMPIYFFENRGYMYISLDPFIGQFPGLNRVLLRSKFGSSSGPDALSAFEPL